MSGRALLIGASGYGGETGFIDLPADRDVELMRQTLLKRNFAVEVADEATTRNATLLDQRIAEFCASGDEGAMIVYFSGHGLSIGQQDWIIPAGVRREDAFASTNQRVPTDLSNRVAANDDGRVVLFIIDACRDEDQTSKGAQSFGWSKGAVASRDSNFIRLFGCSAGEACHVLRKGHVGQDISVFTKALSVALAPESPVNTLGQLLEAAKRECKRLAKEANPKLPVQSRCVNFAADRATANDDPFSLPMFAERVSEAASFGPSKLNCLVVESEHARHDSGPRLSKRVRDAFSKAGAAIWTVFREALDGVEFVDGSARDLATTYEPALRVIDVRSIVDVFASEASLEQAILAAVRADLAFFDVSIFEPGVMFLLGVRAAIRRGVTVCSHGWGWHEGEPLDKPFNLSDLQIFSHAQGGYVGADPVVQRFVEAIQSGFRQLKRQPRYQDLPAYDALRELGPGVNASGTIPWNEYVLMLCSFRKEHQKGWEYVRGKLEDALQARGTHSPRVQRLIDNGSPQLVSQALYENIRRASACVMDWSYFSPSTFLELGVRLVVSPWGALQVIDERFLPSAELAPHVRLADGPELQQVGKMVKRFEPRAYRIDGEAPFDELLALLVQRRPFDEDETDYNRIHRLIQKEIGSVSPTMPGVHDVMRRAADTLSDAEQDRRAASQVLFSANEDIKRDREHAALEYRISAWLYLEHRAGARSRPDGDRLREAHRSLGQIVASALYDTGNDADFLMAQEIESLSKSEKRS
jgi:Caspase domain